MIRVTITINDDERDALIDLAQRERRDPRDQAALMIRQQLETFGYLPPQPTQPTQKTNTTQAGQS